MAPIPEKQPARLTDQIPSAYAKFAQVYQSRCATAMQTYLEATGQATDVWLNAVQPLAPTELWRDVTPYSSDFVQRSLLFWDTLRQRGNNWLAHEKAGKPPLLAFDWEMVAGARGFERSVNYALVRSGAPPAPLPAPDKRPFVIIAPRAGHGPGIGGFKPD